MANGFWAVLLYLPWSRRIPFSTVKRGGQVRTAIFNQPLLRITLSALLLVSLCYDAEPGDVGSTRCAWVLMLLGSGLCVSFRDVSMGFITKVLNVFIRGGNITANGSSKLCI